MNGKSTTVPVRNVVEQYDVAYGSHHAVDTRTINTAAMVVVGAGGLMGQTHKRNQPNDR